MGMETQAVGVDDSWTKKQLIEECRRRKARRYSRLDKAGLIHLLNNDAVFRPTARTADGTNETRASSSAPGAHPQQDGRRRGVRSYRTLAKKGGEDPPSERKDGKRRASKSRGGSKSPSRKPTLKELQAECRERGITGFSGLKKDELIQRMKDYSEGSKGGKRWPISEKLAQRSRSRGPLRSRARKRFEAGPNSNDTTGFIYAYFERGGPKDEWKIGKTKLDPPQRRMHQSASKNNKSYQLKRSWPVAWCGYAEKVVHLDLDDMRVTPAKCRPDGSGIEDGGTEWFRGNYNVIEDRIRLVLRMIAAREADEADAAGVSTPCGIFRFGLPTVRRRGRGRGRGRPDGKGPE